MATQAFKNNAASVFASTTAGILPVGGLSFTVTTGGGAKLPAVSGGDYFYLTLFEKDGSDVEENYEVVKCTGVSGDTITISERDIESLVGVAGGRAYPTVGGRTVYVQMRVTAGTLNNFSQKTATETLTNKTVMATAMYTDATVLTVGAGNTSSGKSYTEYGASSQRFVSGGTPSRNMSLYGNGLVLESGVPIYTGIASAGVPAYSFSGDINTGIYSPGADQLGFSTGGTNRLTIGSTGTITLDSGQLKFPATQNASADANTLDDYREATATLTATGMTTAPTGTATFVKTGRMVTTEVPYITGTSNATTFTLTGIPTEFRPTTTRYVFVLTQDNGGSWAFAAATISSAGVLTLYKDANQSAFTASGAKAVGGYQLSYII